MIVEALWRIVQESATLLETSFGHERSGPKLAQKLLFEVNHREFFINDLMISQLFALR